jgi:hypothetical protein
MASVVIARHELAPRRRRQCPPRNSPASPDTALRLTTPEAPHEAPVAQTAPEAVAPSAPAARSLDPEQMQQMALDLAALRQTVEHLAARSRPDGARDH